MNNNKSSVLPQRKTERKKEEYIRKRKDHINTHIQKKERI